ncbi:glycosyltransferase [Williamsia deligens]|uniref:Glycosyltransferase n=1 Tax=Williamsia deligens TaxID=321325 RepID=A0ABW3G3Z1_9NOCA|nr:glycosyltransferase [Williamsia deligens]MCP2194526.1 Glycosyl transferases group 1 [Williamsia deligens]
MVFHTARSVHLYRVQASLAANEPRKLYYRHHSYDWDEDLAEAVGAQRVSYPGLAVAIVRDRPRSIEINEPLYVQALALAMFTVAMSRVAKILRKGESESWKIVFYAIENLDPFATLDHRVGRRPMPFRLMGRPAAIIARIGFKFVIENTFRIAFGSPGARRTYENLGVDTSDAPTRCIAEFLELPAVCKCGNLEKKRHTLLFVGEFSARKGVPELLDAWTRLEVIAPTTRFVLIGKGPLEGAVREWATARPSTSLLLIDPPRDVIHAHYREASVFFLLSQPDPVWREQVGLPIKEALSHGCLVITTTETGLAGWLGSNGHVLLPPGPLTPDTIAEISKKVTRQSAQHTSLTALPAVDARDAADRWLHR